MRTVLATFLAALSITACTDEEHSICEEHLGSKVTVHADGLPTIHGEMFYCYGDNGFSVITGDENMVSFPYHSVNAVIVTEQEFLIQMPE